jgi:hypothetical protein
MGLDMHLYVEKFVSNAEYRKEQDKFDAIIKVLNADTFAKDHAIIEIEVAYWRKANAIHGWFIKDVEEDDCKPIYFQREEIAELLSRCKQVIESRSKDVAEELLPPTTGFFFGSYEIDDFYWGEVEETAEVLDKILTNVPEGWSFKYQASW